MPVRRILLAEDDSDDQKLFCDFLAHRDDIVLLPVAENGVELLAQLESAADDELPHLVILDQNMPKRNGLQTLAALKESQRFAHLPVVIYSTYADDQLVGRARDGGAVLVVAKPITKNGYNEMMETILDVIA